MVSNDKKERPKWQLQRLRSMYFAMHCCKCKKFELPEEESEQTEYQKICEPNMQKIMDNIEVKEMKFKSFKEFIKWYNDKIHLGLSRKEGITPNEAIINKLQPEAILGLFLRLKN